MTLMELIGGWRNDARILKSLHYQGLRKGLNGCADELEALVREWDKEWSQVPGRESDLHFASFIIRRDILGTVKKE